MAGQLKILLVSTVALLAACGGEEEVVIHLQTAQVPPCPPPNKQTRLRSWSLVSVDEGGVKTDLGCTEINRAPAPASVLEQIHQRGYLVRDLDSSRRRLVATGYSEICGQRLPKHALFCLSTAFFSAETRSPVSTLISCGPLRCANPPVP